MMKDLDTVLCELDMCKLLLKEELTYIEGTAQAISKGPMINNIDRLAITIADILKE